MVRRLRLLRAIATNRLTPQTPLNPSPLILQISESLSKTQRHYAERIDSTGEAKGSGCVMRRTATEPHGIIMAPVLSAQQHRIEDQTGNESCKETGNGDASACLSAQSDLYWNSNAGQSDRVQLTGSRSRMEEAVSSVGAKRQRLCGRRMAPRDRPWLHCGCISCVAHGGPQTRSQ